MSRNKAQRTKNKRIPFIVLSCLFALCVFLVSQQSRAAAPPIAATPCDSLYYESLSARAWLEAQREITQNQNLILKPDSVLEYTCFDMYLRELADHAGGMLSETTLFGAPLSPISMDLALNDLVGTALISYIATNYTHTSLGGHPAGAAIDHMPAPITGGTYNCDIMARVWQAAKCINFITNPAEDGFYTFEEYSTQADKRYLPIRCVPPVSGQFLTNINVALNPATTPWTPDPLITYASEIDPSNCSLLSPIPTGIKVTRPVITPLSFDEHICLPPGCRYDPVIGNCTPF